MTAFKLASALIILLVAAGGGYYPLSRRGRTRSREGLPEGESFTAGVFLALSLLIMLPAALHLFDRSSPHASFPVAAAHAIVAFVLLLAFEQYSSRLRPDESSETGLSPPPVP